MGHHLGIDDGREGRYVAREGAFGGKKGIHVIRRDDVDTYGEGGSWVDGTTTDPMGSACT